MPDQQGLSFHKTKDKAANDSSLMDRLGQEDLGGRGARREVWP